MLYFELYFVRVQRKQHYQPSEMITFATISNTPRIIHARIFWKNMTEQTVSIFQNQKGEASWCVCSARIDSVFNLLNLLNGSVSVNTLLVSQQRHPLTKYDLIACLK